jgi:hypothetical protein
MLLQAATKLAAGNSDAPAPAPAAPEGSTQLIPSARANGRAMAISGAGRMVRALRNQPPIPKRPAEGFDREFVVRVSEMIRRSEFKRQMPPIAKVGGRSSGSDYLYPRRRPKLD